MCGYRNCRTVTPQGEKGNTGNFSGLDNIVRPTGASYALSASESGSVLVFDRANGVDVTLPESSVGLNYEFVVNTSVTTNDYSISMTDATDLFKGFVFKGLAADFDTISSPNGTTNNIMSMNGTTTGGLIGTRFSIKCLVDGFWFVEGKTYGSGALVTPFSG